MNMETKYRSVIIEIFRSYYIDRDPSIQCIGKFIDIMKFQFMKVLARKYRYSILLSYDSMRNNIISKIVEYPISNSYTSDIYDIEYYNKTVIPNLIGKCIADRIINNEDIPMIHEDSDNNNIITNYAYGSPLEWLSVERFILNGYITSIRQANIDHYGYHDNTWSNYNERVSEYRTILNSIIQKYNRDYGHMKRSYTINRIINKYELSEEYHLL